MAAQRGLLLIADIGGYTRFMHLHRLSLAHAQDVTGRLLTAVVEAVPQLRLIEIEGDAGFFYGADTKPSTTVELALAMHRAFHAQQARMVALNLCSCSGCVQAGRLKLKCVAHCGEVATQTIGRTTTLVGVDVIAVHRMLKNDVPVPEYVLITAPIYEDCDSGIKDRATGLEQELEGLGRTQTYWLDIADAAGEVAPPPTATFAHRVRETAGVIGRSLPYLLGMRRFRYALEADRELTRAD